MTQDEFVDSVLDFKENVVKNSMESCSCLFLHEELKAYVDCEDRYGGWTVFPIRVTGKNNIVIDTFTDKTYPLTKEGMAGFITEYRSYI